MWSHWEYNELHDKNQKNSEERSIETARYCNSEGVQWTACLKIQENSDERSINTARNWEMQG